MRALVLAVSALVVAASAVAQERVPPPDREELRREELRRVAEGLRMLVPPVGGRMPPQRPFDVLERLFDVPPDLRGLVGEMRRQWTADRQQALEKIEADLDAQYGAQLTQALPPELAALLDKALAALDAYREAVDLAEADFRAEWQRITGNPPSYVPQSPWQALAALPGLDRETRRAVQRALIADAGLYRTLNVRAAEKALAEKGIERPADPADRAARMEYNRARTEMQRELIERSQAEATERAKAVLPPEAQQQYGEIVKALDEMKQKQSAALDALKKELAGVVPPERLDMLVNQPGAALPMTTIMRVGEAVQADPPPIMIGPGPR